jgi:hypothetical protein
MSDDFTRQRKVVLGLICNNVQLTVALKIFAEIKETSL